MLTYHQLDPWEQTSVNYGYAMIFIPEKKTFKNVVCKIVATLSQYLPPGALIRWMFFSTSTMSRFFRNSLPFFNLDKQGKEIDGLMQKRCSNSSVLATDLHLFHYPIESDSLEAVKSHELSKLQRNLGFLSFCIKFFHKQKFIFQNINGQRNILSNLEYNVHQIPTLKWFSNRLAVVSPQSIEARC